VKVFVAALASVIALTVTTAAFADEPAAPTPAPAASTPLQVRPSKALQMAPANESTPLGYKLAAGGVVVAAAALWAKKKKGGLTKSKTKKKSAIDILGRASIGVRNELIVVDVEGTRLLIGMTPGSMQTLAVLQTPEGVIGELSPYMGEEAYMDALPAAVPVRPAPVLVRPPIVEEEADEQAEEEVEELSDRVRSLLEARKKREQSARPVTSPPARRPQHTQAMKAKATVPGQAKGLLLSMQEGGDDRPVTKLGDW